MNKTMLYLADAIVSIHIKYNIRVIHNNNFKAGLYLVFGD